MCLFEAKLVAGSIIQSIFLDGNFLNKEKKEKSKVGIGEANDDLSDKNVGIGKNT